MEVYWKKSYYGLWYTKRSIISVDNQEALRILEEIEDQVVNVCCVITMEPDDVLILIDKLKSYINEQS